MSFVDRCIIVCCKLAIILIRRAQLGAGATWPGELALRLSPHILSRFSRQNIRVILVAGTNGKTTTAKMIETVCAHQHISVHRNESGANLDNGIVSSFIEDCGWLGTLRSSIFIFEVDEATLPNILPNITPQVIVLLNLFRDQLDRYGEVDAIAERWRDALSTLDTGLPAACLPARQGKAGDQRIKQYQTTVVINADDPHLVYIGNQLKVPVEYFGLEDSTLFLDTMQHATDTIYCPNCGQRLTFGGTYFSHLGKWACGKCGFTHPSVSLRASDVVSPLPGVYNIYNTLAATLTARIVGIHEAQIRTSLEQFSAAFGRFERLSYQGKSVTILLSKNPTGCNESLRAVLSSQKKGPLLLVLNDRIPDGTDVSWIWDVDFELLRDYRYPIVVSGDRCYDMGLRLKYADISQNQKHISQANTIQIQPDLRRAIRGAIEMTSKEETLWILPTYSAMLNIRKILTGKAIL